LLILQLFTDKIALMPTLHWIGKEKVINHHMGVPFKVLEHSYGFSNGEQTEEETGSVNKIKGSKVSFEC
jgi:hypothetical protein